ncbi:MAG: 5'-phosphate synthase pdxT subunit [Glaciecola sp.]
MDRTEPPVELPHDAPIIGVLALQGDVVEHLRALARVGARGVRVRRIGDLDQVDGLVIPGGESTTIGKLLERFGLFGPLQARLQAGLPAFGTCAGMILLSRELDQDEQQTLFGVLEVTTRRNAFGRQIDSFERDLDITSIGAPAMRAAFIRAPYVVEVGEAVEVLAQVDGHPVLVTQGGRLLASSFHPEMTGDDRLHAHFVAMVRAVSAS